MAPKVAQASGDEAGVVRVETDGWPLVVFRMPHLVDVKASLELGRAIDALLLRRQRFVMVVTNAQMVDMPADARKAMATWEKAQDAPLRAYAKAAALVMPNRTLFAIAGLICWLNPPPYPKKCFLDEAEAIAWARERLDRA